MASISYLFLIGLVYFQASMQGSSAKSPHPVNTGFVNEEIPKECEATGYCQDSQGHPEELAAKLVRELLEAGVPLDSDANYTTKVIEFRNHYTAEATCIHSTQTIIPLMLKDETDGEWYYVVNTKDQPIQKYNVQICVEPSPGEPAQECSKEMIFQNYYDSRCVQKYITRKIMAVKNGKCHPILARIPCCCSCVAIKTNQ